jgi:hypothetical protein
MELAMFQEFRKRDYLASPAKNSVAKKSGAPFARCAAD